VEDFLDGDLDQGKLSELSEGYYPKAGCFGETIDLRLKYRMIRIESEPINSS
jgi:hypothetical protein